MYVSTHGALVPLHQPCSVNVGWEKCGMPASSSVARATLSALGKASPLISSMSGEARISVLCRRESMYPLVSVVCKCVRVEYPDGGGGQRVANAPIYSG